MPNLNRTPAYNLKAVLKETGLKADVLRAWERRYELPQPQRSQGGHRLYSEFDIETIKWLRTRQAEGLSISRAAELWKEISSAGHDPLAEYSPVAALSIPQHGTVAEQPIEILRQNWLEASLAFDSIRVDEILNQAFALYPVERVCTEILHQGLSDIGQFWYEGKVTVQQEHFATALASRRVEAIIAAMPRPARPQSIVIGCPPGELHTFPLLLLSLFLGRRGWKVIYLGADMPLEQLEDSTALAGADLVVLAVQRLATAATLQAMAFAMRSLGVRLAYGGQIFNRVPALRERIPGHFLGEGLEKAVERIERLVTTAELAPNAIAPEQSHRVLAGLYQMDRPFIERVVVERLPGQGAVTGDVKEANHFFGEGLAAALALGSPAFLEPDLEWLNHLLAGRMISAQSLMKYLTAYSLAIREVMGPVGGSISDWLDTYIAT